MATESLTRSQERDAFVIVETSGIITSDTLINGNGTRQPAKSTTGDDKEH